VLFPSFCVVFHLTKPTMEATVPVVSWYCYRILFACRVSPWLHLEDNHSLLGTRRHMIPGLECRLKEWVVVLDSSAGHWFKYLLFVKNLCHGTVVVLWPHFLKIISHLPLLNNRTLWFKYNAYWKSIFIVQELNPNTTGLLAGLNSRLNGLAVC
jgi:hypothetical protein